MPDLDLRGQLVFFPPMAGVDRPVIICLGNPGPRYADTRHNLGWWVGDLVVAKLKIAFKSGAGRYLSAQKRTGGTTVLLVKPTTFMNASGEALDDLRKVRDLDLDDLVVVADDIDLPLGRIRIRTGGSSGGHNGLESVIAALGTERFARVRCGVGPVPAGADPAEFVLDRFAPDELIVAREMAARGAGAVMMIIARGVAAAANEYNRKPPAPDESADGPTGAQ